MLNKTLIALCARDIILFSPSAASALHQIGKYDFRMDWRASSVQCDAQCISYTSNVSFVRAMKMSSSYTVAIIYLVDGQQWELCSHHSQLFSHHHSNWYEMVKITHLTYFFLFLSFSIDWISCQHQQANTCQTWTYFHYES